MLAGASAAPHPGFVPPCLAMLRKDKGGTGFTMRTAAKLRQRLEPLILQRSPLSMRVREKAVWVKPTLSALVTYREITAEGLLRHAVFKRLSDGSGGAAD
jgi:bifunctional non-homologous end joining protein LigD